MGSGPMHRLRLRMCFILLFDAVCRPLKALVHNCQLLVDLAGRNAIWGAAAHLFLAFKPLVPAPKRSPPGSSQPPGTPGLHRGSSGLQRGHSGVPSPAIGGKGLLQQGSFTHQGCSSQTLHPDFQRCSHAAKHVHTIKRQCTKSLG